MDLLLKMLPQSSKVICVVRLTYPTKPLTNIDDPEGEISPCTLSAVNWGAIKSLEQMEKVCDLAVRALDEPPTTQEYPIEAARVSTMNRRPVRIGIINFAYWMAKNDSTYPRTQT